MQSTATSKPNRRIENRIGAVIIALIVIFTVGVVISANHETEPVVLAPQPAALPVTTLPQPASFERMRFIEMNTLPQAPTVSAPEVERWMMIESHRRPEASQTGPPADVLTRLYEANMQPGDDAPLLAPSTDGRGVRH